MQFSSVLCFDDKDQGSDQQYPAATGHRDWLSYTSWVFSANKDRLHITGITAVFKGQRMRRAPQQRTDLGRKLKAEGSEGSVCKGGLKRYVGAWARRGRCGYPYGEVVCSPRGWSRHSWGWVSGNGVKARMEGIHIWERVDAVVMGDWVRTEKWIK